jgi:hypothetical protein
MHEPHPLVGGAPCDLPRPHAAPVPHTSSQLPLIETGTGTSIDPVCRVTTSPVVKRDVVTRKEGITKVTRALD